MNYLVAPADGPHFYLFIDRSANPGEPGRAGLSHRGAVSSRDWDAVRETLILLSIPGMRDSIRKRAAKSSRNA
jgi:hypothetical protein